MICPLACLSCFSPGRGWVPRGHNWRSIYCGECRIQSIIIKLSCFCTFSYHTSKGDCDPDSEHDYCSLHVRLRAGQVTAQSFFKLSLDHFFWWEGFWVRNFHCVTRAPLLYFMRSWVALSFKVWPSIINYQLLPPHSVLYWPSTQLHHLVTHSWANWI